MDIDIQRRILARISTDDVTGCWIWQGAPNQDGYGSLSIEDRKTLAHRAAFEAFTGNTLRQCCLHHCDVRACVNPDHLYDGSPADNTADMDKRGRRGKNPNRTVLRGEKHPRASLKDSQVREVRRLMAAGGMTRKAIAAEIGTTKAIVDKIAEGKCYRTIV